MTLHEHYESAFYENGRFDGHINVPFLGFHGESGG